MGGSSGGGGSSSSSNKYDWPSYLKDIHRNYIGSARINQDMTALVNEALANNPYNDPRLVDYDPSVELSYMDAYGCHYHRFIEEIVPEMYWSDYWKKAMDEVMPLIQNEYVDKLVDAHGDSLKRDLEYKVLPFYQRGMQNIGAVMTSAYKLGETWLWAQRDQELSKFDADSRYKTYQVVLSLLGDSVNQQIQILSLVAEGEKNNLHYGMEFERLSITSMAEYHANVNETLVSRALWKLEATKYFNDAVRAIMGGGSMGASEAKKDKAVSAIGGALSGAALGATVGSVFPGVGTAVGAAAGGVIGGLGGFFA